MQQQQQDQQQGEMLAVRLRLELPGDPASLLLRLVSDDEETADEETEAKRETAECDRKKADDWTERLVLRYPAADRLTVGTDWGSLVSLLLSVFSHFICRYLTGSILVLH